MRVLRATPTCLHEVLVRVVVLVAEEHLALQLVLPPPRQARRVQTLQRPRGKSREKHMDAISC